MGSPGSRWGRLFLRTCAVSGAIALSGCAGPQSNAVLPEPPSPATPAAAFQLTSRGEGLPRSGQWRSQLAVADINGDAYPDLVVPAARKGSGRPQVFLGKADASWSRWSQINLPNTRFDYGGLAVLDLDADGRLDLALGMHLKGLAALTQNSPGNFQDAGKGLNSLVDGQDSATGSQSLLALPRQGASGGARLFVAYEAVRNAGVGASLWRLVEGKWQRRDVPGAPSGSHASRGNRDQVFYLAAAGVVAVDVSQELPASQFAVRMPAGTFSHALATSTDADRGTTGAYVSISRFIDGAWTRRVERFQLPARLGAESPAATPGSVVAERAGASYFSAVAVRNGEPWGLAGDVVAAGDDHGNIEIYQVQGAARPVKLGQWPAADWRKGCNVSYLEWAKIQPAEPPQLVAMFSGEVSAYDIGRGCSNSGGLDVFSATLAPPASK